MAIRCSQEANLTFRFACCACEGFLCCASYSIETRLQQPDWKLQVKRRWDDDVVFKNQARGEPKAHKRFINDTIRSDFHRRFLTRYIK